MMDLDKLKKIKAIAFDIDGVMTDGGILATSDGDLLRIFDAKDSFGVRMAKLNGLITCVITGGASDSIKKRFVYWTKRMFTFTPESKWRNSTISVQDTRSHTTK